MMMNEWVSKWLNGWMWPAPFGSHMPPIDFSRFLNCASTTLLFLWVMPAILVHHRAFVCASALILNEFPFLLYCWLLFFLNVTQMSLPQGSYLWPVSLGAPVLQLGVLLAQVCPSRAATPSAVQLFLWLLVRACFLHQTGLPRLPGSTILPGFAHHSTWRLLNAFFLNWITGND